MSYHTVVHIPTRAVGAVIGRGGSVVSGIRTRTGCTVSVLQERELPDSTVEVTGPEQWMVEGAANEVLAAARSGWFEPVTAGRAGRGPPRGGTGGGARGPPRPPPPHPHDFHPAPAHSLYEEPFYAATGDGGYRAAVAGGGGGGGGGGGSGGGGGGGRRRRNRGQRGGRRSEAPQHMGRDDFEDFLRTFGMHTMGGGHFHPPYGPHGPHCTCGHTHEEEEEEEDPATRIQAAIDALGTRVFSGAPAATTTAAASGASGAASGSSGGASTPSSAALVSGGGGGGGGGARGRGRGRRAAASDGGATAASAAPSPASAAAAGSSAPGGGASAGALDAPAASTNEPACAICIADFAHGDSLRTLPCGHEFHVACIDEWLVLKPLCPTCRGLIHPDLEDVLAAPEDPYGSLVDLRELAHMLNHGRIFGDPYGAYYYYSDDDDDGGAYYDDEY